MKRLPLLVLEITLIVALGVWVVIGLRAAPAATRAGGVDVTVQLSGAADNAVLFKDADGQFRYEIEDGLSHARVTLTPEELAARMHRDRTARSWAQKVLNVSDPFGYVWVGLGLLGQILFTGRMVVQWLASEREKKSVVPPVFWWMSLAGSTMLMAYFAWRRDPVGLLGQSFGWFIYVRNLWMIYRPDATPAQAVALTGTP